VIVINPSDSELDPVARIVVRATAAVALPRLLAR
jgi:hypothetical protein